MTSPVDTVTERWVRYAIAAHERGDMIVKNFYHWVGTNGLNPNAPPGPTDEQYEEVFRAALNRSDLAKVTTGHSVSPNSVNVYMRDPKSPSGVWRVASAHRSERTDEILRECGKTAWWSGH